MKIVHLYKRIPNIIRKYTPADTNVSSGVKVPDSPLDMPPSYIQSVTNTYVPLEVNTAPIIEFSTAVYNDLEGFTQDVEITRIGDLSQNSVATLHIHRYDTRAGYAVGEAPYKVLVIIFYTGESTKTFKVESIANYTLDLEDNPLIITLAPEINCAIGPNSSCRLSTTDLTIRVTNAGFCQVSADYSFDTELDKEFEFGIGYPPQERITDAGFCEVLADMSFDTELDKEFMFSGACDRVITIAFGEGGFCNVSLISDYAFEGAVGFCNVNVQRAIDFDPFKYYNNNIYCENVPTNSITYDLRQPYTLEAYCEVNPIRSISYNVNSYYTLASGFCSITAPNTTNAYLNSSKYTKPSGFCFVSFSDPVVYSNLSKYTKANGYCSNTFNDIVRYNNLQKYTQSVGYCSTILL